MPAYVIIVFTHMKNVEIIVSSTFHQMSDRTLGSTRYDLRSGTRARSHDGIHGILEGNQVRRGSISGITFQSKPVTYTVVSNCAVFEGDIILETLNDEGGSSRGTGGRPSSPSAFRTGLGTEMTRRLWPNRIVPYAIDPNFPSRMRRRIEQAISRFRYRTRLNFYERTEARAKAYPNYVNIRPSEGTWSFVGMRGGRQDLGLVTWCSKAAIIHELGHTVGLWHEQSREDRDNFVKIVQRNIKPGHVHNFDQHITDGDDYGEYDYESVMHYGPYVFSRNGRKTIEQMHPPPPEIGEAEDLSDGDVATIDEMYSKLRRRGRPPRGVVREQPLI